MPLTGGTPTLSQAGVTAGISAVASVGWVALERVSVLTARSGSRVWFFDQLPSRAGLSLVFWSGLSLDVECAVIQRAVL